jgi:two-component system, LytTR family, sensor kinase
MPINFSRHVLFWIIYAFINTIIHWAQSSPGHFFILDQLSKYGLAVMLFYSYLRILKAKFTKHSRAIKLVMVCIIVCLYYLVKWLLYYFLFPAISYMPRPLTVGKQFYLTSVWWCAHYFLYAYFYWLFYKTIEIKTAAEKLKTQNAELKFEKNNAEYQKLRAQINPHFLYNTLGLLYNSAAQSSPKTANGIYLLSQVMRYSIDNEKDRDYVSLEEEVKQLQNYIELQQLRYDYELPIEFLTQGIFSNYCVLPHILITIVENAFKHGEIECPNSPLKILLKVENDSIFFTVENKIGRNFESRMSSGRGQINIKGRLEAVYNNNFTYNTIAINDTYTVSLSMANLYPKTNLP